MKRFSVIAMACILLSFTVQAQTDEDAIMMNKYQWCNGISYEHSHWKDYWEGTLKRNNQNIGTFTSQSAMLMSNYGITDRLNVMAGLPYIWNNVSAGTLHKMSGWQDVSAAIKWKAVAAKWGKTKLGLYAIGSVGTPTQNYVVDFLPLAIGFGSTNVTGRALADVQVGKFFTTASYSYTLRGKTKIDRNSYYTDHLIYSNRVAMPNVTNYMLSAGFRGHYLIAEAMITNMTTLGGFDIRRNDMPFPSNRMNMTSIGAHVKYTLPFYTHLELTADASHVIRGRNVGQATNVGAGVFYIFSFKHKTNLPPTHS